MRRVFFAAPLVAVFVAGCTYNNYPAVDASHATARPVAARDVRAPRVSSQPGGWCRRNLENGQSFDCAKGVQPGPSIPGQPDGWCKRDRQTGKLYDCQDGPLGS